MTEETFDLQQYASPAQVAAACDVSERSVWRWVQIGRLPKPLLIRGRAYFPRTVIEQAKSAA